MAPLAGWPSQSHQCAIAKVSLGIKRSSTINQVLILVPAFLHPEAAAYCYGWSESHVVLSHFSPQISPSTWQHRIWKIGSTTGRSLALMYVQARMNVLTLTEDEICMRKTYEMRGSVYRSWEYLAAHREKDQGKLRVLQYGNKPLVDRYAPPSFLTDISSLFGH